MIEGGAVVTRTVLDLIPALVLFTGSLQDLARVSSRHSSFHLRSKHMHIRSTGDCKWHLSVGPDGDPSGAYSSLLFGWDRTNTLHVRMGGWMGFYTVCPPFLPAQFPHKLTWSGEKLQVSNKILLSNVMHIAGERKWSRTHNLEEET